MGACVNERQVRPFFAQPRFAISGGSLSQGSFENAMLSIPPGARFLNATKTALISA